MLRVKSSKINNIISRRFSFTIDNASLLKSRALINGEWVELNDLFEVSNPATGDIIGNVANCGIPEYNDAIKSAANSFKVFKGFNVRERSQLLENVYGLIQKYKHDLAKILTVENGKPLRDSLSEIEYSSMYFKWFAEEAPRIDGSIISSGFSSNQKIFSFRQPLGVVGILTPWNFPIAMMARKLAPVIATGNTCVIKPAHETPFSALAMGAIVQEAGVPAGVCNILPTIYTPEVGKYICEHELVKKITFTGSTNVGKLLMAQASKGSNIKRFSMELGGNSPFIVFQDADLNRALNGIITSKFRQSGQTCICANRIFVHESIYSIMASMLVDYIDNNFVLGDGLKDGVTHGPLIHQDSVDKVSMLVQDAKSKGARVLTGGSRASALGPLFYQPTVLADVDESMNIFHEEIFGPVASLIRFKELDEVIERANNTNVGLAGYFYSQNLSTVFEAAERLEVGMIGVNTGAISEPALPFGGVKDSGLGREGSKFGIEDYTEIKSVLIAH